jgi:hypothetical protein
LAAIDSSFRERGWKKKIAEQFHVSPSYVSKLSTSLDSTPDHPESLIDSIEMFFGSY